MNVRVIDRTVVAMVELYMASGLAAYFAYYAVNIPMKQRILSFARDRNICVPPAWPQQNEWTQYEIP
jgi:hypothetical protein